MAPSFSGSTAFLNAYAAVKAYFLDENGFGLQSEDNLLDLFDSKENANAILARIETWLSERLAPEEKDGGKISDLFIYYVGHGGLGKGNDAYFMAIRSTRDSDRYTHSITLYALAAILREYASGLRRFLILDSCFAASAIRNTLAAPDSLIASQVRAAGFSEPAKNEEELAAQNSPGSTRGTSLLCASSATERAKYETDKQDPCTYFSKALVQVLRQGAPKIGVSRAPHHLSLRQVGALVSNYLDKNVPFEDRVQPQVHSPGQWDGWDIADEGIFPNPASPIIIDPLPEFHPIGRLIGHANHIDCAAWSPDGKWLASGSYDNTIRVWSTDTFNCVREHRGHSQGVSDVAWSADSQQFASSSYDKTVRLWSADSGERWRFEGHKESVRCVVWTNNDCLIASGANGGSARLWSLATRSLFKKFAARSEWVNAIAFSAYTGQLAIGLGDGYILLRDPLDDEEQKSKLKAHHNYVNALTWMPNTSFLCSGSGAGSIRVWDMQKKSCVEFLDEHTDKILGLSFSMDGSRLASLGQDRLIVWRTSDWKPVHTVRGPFPTNTHLPLAFSPSGNRLAVPVAGNAAAIQILENS